MKFKVESWNEENKKLFEDLCCGVDTTIINGCSGKYDEINIYTNSIQFKNSKTLINIVVDAYSIIDWSDNLITRYGMNINETTRICVDSLEAVKSIIKTLFCK